jgi:hypothetical protein
MSRETAPIDGHLSSAPDASDTATPPFFVVGSARSGTTMLKSMLDRNDAVAIPPESHFIPAMWKRRTRYAPDGRLTRPDLFLRDLRSFWAWRYWDLPIEQVAEEIERSGATTVSGAIEGAFRAYARRDGKSRWGDKTPRYVENIRLLNEVFPSCRIVHMIRDGRDVALSMIAQNHLHQKAATPAFFWARSVAAGRDAGRSLGDRYYEICYENVVRDAERELTRLCSFLELEFDSTMLDHGDGLAKLPKQFHRMHGGLARPTTAGMRDWRTQMAPNEVAEFEAIAGGALREFGYVADTEVTVATRMRAWGRVGAFVLRTARRRSKSRARRERSGTREAAGGRAA